AAPRLPRSPRNTRTQTPRSSRARPRNASALVPRFAQEIAGLSLEPAKSAVAVSGGSDSLALMLLLADFVRERGGLAPTVLTVDHGLRAGSAKEAGAVVRAAKDAGLTAHVLTWRGAKPKANIEGRARETRYRLMGEWCR